jgi:RNA polymerase sigma-70 factor (ECF subfamily)
LKGPPVDEEVFKRLVEANKRRIMWIARSYASRDSVKDLYQEILFEIWKGLPGFQGRARVETWIYRVALRTAIHFRRRAAGSVESAATIREEEAAYGPPPSAWLSESQILSEFIGTLDEVDRSLFLMYLDGDFGYADMAEVTGLNEPHIRVKISRIKKSYVDNYIRK